MTTHSCETCIHSAPRTFAGREELRCFKATRDRSGIGWSVYAETHEDNPTQLKKRCGPDLNWYESRE